LVYIKLYRYFCGWTDALACPTATLLVNKSMITKIEIDGFKTFRNFKLELAPFQVIVGLNGVGKSNLFDALSLLSLLASDDLLTAFQKLRGAGEELFTVLPNGQSFSQMKFLVEIFVELQVKDVWGASATLKYTRMRYELQLSRHADELGLERFYVDNESLKSIPRSEDKWIKSYKLLSQSDRLPKLTGGRPSFISTEDNKVNLHQDGRAGGKRELAVAGKAERTILSSVTSVEFPHAFAARKEMLDWRFLQLNPEALREPSSMLVEKSYLLADGSNLPAVLARMQAQDSFTLNDVSLDLANLVPGILKIEIDNDQERRRYIIRAITQDNRSFSSRVLSDGTLRMLALATLRNDPENQGVLCFEEPENGVHPFRLKKLVELLRGLASDFSDATQIEEPLRQLLINTHSPVLVSQLVNLDSTSDDISYKIDVAKELLFAYTTTQLEPEISDQRLRVTRMVPLKSSGQLVLRLDEEPEKSYIVAQVIEYLNSADTGEARDNLQKAITL